MYWSVLWDGFQLLKCIPCCQALCTGSQSGEQISLVSCTTMQQYTFKLYRQQLHLQPHLLHSHWSSNMYVLFTECRGCMDLPTGFPVGLSAVEFSLWVSLQVSQQVSLCRDFCGDLSRPVEGRLSFCLKMPQRCKYSIAVGLLCRERHFSSQSIFQLQNTFNSVEQPCESDNNCNQFFIIPKHSRPMSQSCPHKRDEMSPDRFWQHSWISTFSEDPGQRKQALIFDLNFVEGGSGCDRLQISKFHFCP